MNLNPYVTGGIVALALSFGAGVWTSSMLWQNKWDERDKADLKSQAAREATNRKTELLWSSKIDEAREDAYKKALQNQKDAGAANAASERLYDAARRVVRTACPSAPITGGSPPEGTPVVVLADVLARINETAGELAAAFDQSYLAGITCERSYDAVGVQ